MCVIGQQLIATNINSNQYNERDMIKLFDMGIK